MIRSTFVSALALLAMAGATSATTPGSIDRTVTVREIERAIDTTYVFP
jgi:hypothetical protein